MAKGKGRPHSVPGTPKGARSKVLIAGRAKPETAARFEAFLKAFNESLGIETDKSQHVEKAINEYLDREEKKLR